MSSDLQARVEKLETSNKNQKLILTALVIFALYGIKVLFFASVPAVIETRSLVVRAADGFTAVSLEPTGLSFYTQSGQITSRLEAHGDNPGLFVQGEKVGAHKSVHVPTSTTGN